MTSEEIELVARVERSLKKALDPLAQRVGMMKGSTEWLRSADGLDAVAGELDEMIAGLEALIASIHATRRDLGLLVHGCSEDTMPGIPSE